MKRIYKGLSVILLMSFVFSTHAAYNANVTSTIAWLKIYNDDIIYFQLVNQPVTQCKFNYFVLDSLNLTANQINRYFSMLLAAKSSKSPIAVGYDGVGVDCFTERAIVHAIETTN